MPFSPFNTEPGPDETPRYIVVGADHSPDTFAFGLNQTKATMVVRFKEAELATLPKYILGYAELGVGATKLTRFLPMYHPLYSWLYAESFTMNFRGVPSKQIFNGVYAKYTAGDDYPIEAVITFGGRPYWIANDDEVVNEQERFIEIIWNPVLDFITNPYNKLIFAETYNGAVTTVNNTGATLQSGSLTRYERMEITAIWHQVPEEAIFTPEGKLSKSITDGIGRVNLTEFWNYPVGTLLAHAPRIVPFIAPVATGFGFGPGNLPRIYNVEFKFTYFNPPTDPATQVGARGWNLKPYGGTDANYWYLVTRDGKTNGYTEYEYYEFDSFFLVNPVP